MQVKKPLIHEMAEQERPREKFELYGADKMSDAELLALILRTGSRSLSAVALAEEILNLNLPGSGLEKLYHLSKKDLMEIRGVGRVKAIEILALCELSVRLSKLTFREQLSFSSPASIARYYMAEFRSYRQEHLMMMLLDSKNHLVGERLISKGTINASMAEPRDIFGEALRAGAFSIILIHNHPSGDTTPSTADLTVTKRIGEAGELLGIRLLDHIIVAGDKYISLKAEGYMTPSAL
ncbi:RadC family protein [Frisingicoccus sp.]|uniref:RadC family protein n=1 Tax=Frisingicoccus sp. TaxID=1918627 RepID=UPI003999AAD3